MADPLVVFDSVQHVGDFFGIHCTFDITKHTDPDIVLEFAYLISLDGGITWFNGGKYVLPGGTYKHPITGDPLLVDGFQCAAEYRVSDQDGKISFVRPYCKAPLGKLIVRSLKGDPAKDVVTIIEPQVIKGPISSAPIDPSGSILASGYIGDLDADGIELAQVILP